ncbi:hypothetical protein DY000_02005699 [Brassica cretica]|uniref:Uncharacterized protein n=1 Tax=Brassica cretica TaxID=69181 RepID=A0ABQ7CA20_BRACR|nr:hypothetical protein DY000_02005699 [Brassica cretica]
MAARSSGVSLSALSNLGSLAELVKDGTRMIHHPQNQKQPQVLQQQLHISSSAVTATSSSAVTATNPAANASTDAANG